MSFGKMISLFLIDGTGDGVIACELFNWTGKGYKIPRSHLRTLANRKDLQKAGVYFLIGRDDEDNDAVYIGEAEEVFKRLLQHQDKEFWNVCLAFVSKDENLNKAHIKYLENSLHREATIVARYKISNTNTPTQSAISEADQAVMSEFAENLKILVGTLGYKLFEKITKAKVTKQDKYYIKAIRGARAEGIITSEGFVVLEGSQIADSEVPSTPEAVTKKREALAKERAVKDNCFSKDYLFSSPSIAAAVVMGRSANGLIEWKKSDGTTLRDQQAQASND